MNIKGNYKELIHNESVVAEKEDVEVGTDFLVLDAVDQILANIESRINDIKDILDKIQGLTEIDDVKLLVRKLSEDLY